MIGAGVGGLTAAALLAKWGFEVTVLEAHVYPGGCAGTFYHRKYRFDAGATLVGGFEPAGPHGVVGELLGLTWPVHPVDPAWVVHLPDGRVVTQFADAARWRDERERHFPGTENFWRTQERLADISWRVSSRPFPWPPQSAGDALRLGSSVTVSDMAILPYLHRSVASLAPAGDPLFRCFLDAHLLISAQTTSANANALYGSAALDLPRRGVQHVTGGVGQIAQTLADSVVAQGGKIAMRQEVDAIEMVSGRAVAVTTRKGLRVPCDVVLANLTPWALHALLGASAPASLRTEVTERLAPTWGAFMLYLGVDKDKFRRRFPDAATHHQVVVDAGLALGETNSVFFSMASEDDPGRAPAGEVPVTMSTHTAIERWWSLHRHSPDEYEAEKARYAEAMLDAIELALPGLRECITFRMTATPISFQRFTRRPQGMVGGFPQTSIWKARGPRTGIPNVLLVGDSIFPGQSTAGVTLGGLRVARQVKQQATSVADAVHP